MPCRLTKLRLVDLAPFISHSILMSLKAAASTSINTHRSPQGAGPYMIDTGILELRLKMIAFLTALIVLLHILLATNFRVFPPLKFHTNDPICDTFVYSLFEALNDISNVESGLIHL